MASIQKRKRGRRTVYRAEIRIKRDGHVVLRDSRTFDYRTHAKAWASQREAELKKPGALAEVSGLTFAELAGRYMAYLEEIRPVSRNKLYTFDRLIRAQIGTKLIARLTPADILEYAKARAAEGAGPSTVGAEVMWIGETLRMANPVFSIPATDEPVTTAKAALKQLRLTGKSRVRTRRLKVMKSPGCLHGSPGTTAELTFRWQIYSVLLCPPQCDSAKSLRFVGRI